MGRVRPSRCRHPVRVDPDTLAGQGLDIGESCDPARPARDGSTRARVPPPYRSKRGRPVLSVPVKGAFGHGVGDDLEIEVPAGIAAGWVDRPAWRRAVSLRARCPVEPLRGLGLDSTGRPEMPAAHLSPAVPPGVGVAHPARRWSISLFTEGPRAWYTDGEPLFQPAWAVFPKTFSPSGSGGSLLSLRRGPREARLVCSGPSSGAARSARRPSPGPGALGFLRCSHSDGGGDSGGPARTPGPVLLDPLLPAQVESTVSESGQSAAKKGER
jgi:hypothetical protein